MMTLGDKIELAQAFLSHDEEATDALVTAYLSDAKDAILRRRFPFISDAEPLPEMPERYDMLQVKLAVRYFLKRGGEGEQTHIENGIHRHYSSLNDDDLLSEVTPLAKVVSL